MPSFWPDDLQFAIDVPAMYSQDSADQIKMVARVMRPGSVASVEFVPAWNMTGANTNSRTLTLYNPGPVGAGTAVVAQLALTSGVNLTQFVPKVITLGAGAARVIAVGDLLEWESLHVGTGLPDPGGRLIVQQSYAP